MVNENGINQAFLEIRSQGKKTRNQAHKCEKNSSECSKSPHSREMSPHVQVQFFIQKAYLRTAFGPKPN